VLCCNAWFTTCTLALVAGQAVELQRGKILASQWSLSKVKTLAALQLQLVLAGLRALKPGGRLVYRSVRLSVCVAGDNAPLPAAATCAKLLSTSHAPVVTGPANSRGCTGGHSTAHARDHNPGVTGTVTGASHVPAACCAVPAQCLPWRMTGWWRQHWPAALRALSPWSPLLLGRQVQPKHQIPTVPIIKCAVPPQQWMPCV
jgi:hypothetical protein